MGDAYSSTNGSRRSFNAATDKSIAVDDIAVLAVDLGICNWLVRSLKTPLGTKNSAGRVAVKPVGELDEVSEDKNGAVLQPSNSEKAAPAQPTAATFRRISRPSQEMMIVFNIFYLQRPANIRTSRY